MKVKKIWDKICSYFGGKYMTYWYIAFAVTVVLMLVFSIKDAKIDNFKFIVYNEDGSVQSEQIISKEEVEMKVRSATSRAAIPEKLF